MKSESTSAINCSTEDTGVFTVKMTRTYVVTREILIEVDTPVSEGLEGAVEQVKSGAIDAPSFDDPRWHSFWEHESMEVEGVHAVVA